MEPSLQLHTPEIGDVSLQLATQSVYDATTITVSSSAPRAQIFGTQPNALKRKGGPTPTLDLDNMPEEHKRVVTTLKRIFSEASESLAVSKNYPATKHELKVYEDTLTEIFGRLSRGELHEPVAEALHLLCKALDEGDDALVFIILMGLQNDHKEECQAWIDPLEDLVAESSAWIAKGGGRDQHLFMLKNTPSGVDTPR